jgi:hypothetical protein
VNITSDTLKDLFASMREAPNRQWTDPSHPFEFKEYLDSIEHSELEHAVREFLECGVLVIECIDSRVQSAAAASVVRALSAQGLALRQGHVSDRIVADVGQSYDDGEFSGWSMRWTVRDILHPKLGNAEPCLLVLEIEGANGQALLDEIFRTKGTFDALCRGLRERRRGLLLLPVARAAAALGRGHAGRGFRVHTLCLDFLPYWLTLQYASEARACLERIRRLHAEGEWGGSDEVLYEWLNAVAQQRGAGTLLDRLEANREPPRVLATVEQALVGSGGEHEALLAAVFVAAFLPGLTQRDFCVAVEAILAGRTRLKARPRSGTEAKDGPPEPLLEVSVVDEWRSGLRAILKTAELEVRLGPARSKVVGFSDYRARPGVKAALDAAPLFVWEQMERLARAGLVFARSEALSTAMVDLVADLTEAEPETYDIEWLLALLGPALAPDAAALDKQLAQFAGAQRALRRLLEGQATATRADTGGRTIVDELFERVLRLDHERAALPIPELALRLRDAPSFDCWYWLRQVLERGKPEVRERALALLRRIPYQREADFGGDIEQLLAWLDPEAKGSQASVAAAAIVVDWVTASIRFCAGQHTEAAQTVTNFLRRVATSEGGLSRLAVALFNPAVVTAASKLENPTLVWKTFAVLLPPEVRAQELGVPPEALFLTMMQIWNAAVAELLEDIDGADLACALWPSLALAAWCEVFRDDAAAMAEVATKLFHSLKSDLRLAVRAWFSVLITVVGEFETQMLEMHELADAPGNAVLRAAIARRKRFEAFRAHLTQQAPVEEGP